MTGKLLQELIDQNARVAQDQTDYQQRSDEMFARYEAAEKALAEAQESLHQKEKHNEQTLDFISEIEIISERSEHSSTVGTEGDKWSWDSTSVLYIEKNHLKDNNEERSHLLWVKI